MRYLTETEAQANSAAICADPVLGEWGVTEVNAHMSAGIGGSGYLCAFGAASCATGCDTAVCTADDPKNGGGLGEEEDLWITSIVVFAALSVYFVGGVGYAYKTSKEVRHPHVEQWKQVSGLVKDGFTFVVAKYQGREFSGDSDGNGEGQSSPLGSKPFGVYGSVGEQTPLQAQSGDLEPPVWVPPAKKPKRKKKKKAGADIEDPADAAPLE